MVAVVIIYIYTCVYIHIYPASQHKFVPQFLWCLPDGYFLALQHTMDHCCFNLFLIVEYLMTINVTDETKGIECLHCCYHGH